LANVVGGLLMAFGLAAIINESTYDTGSGAWTGPIAITMLNIVTVGRYGARHRLSRVPGRRPASA
jgi:hypothetical protein